MPDFLVTDAAKDLSRDSQLSMLSLLDQLYSVVLLWRFRDEEFRLGILGVLAAVCARKVAVRKWANGRIP